MYISCIGAALPLYISKSAVQVSTTGIFLCETLAEHRSGKDTIQLRARPIARIFDMYAALFLRTVHPFINCDKTTYRLAPRQSSY